jgi:hypothetical protein
MCPILTTALIPFNLELIFGKAASAAGPSSNCSAENSTYRWKNTYALIRACLDTALTEAIRTQLQSD